MGSRAEELFTAVGLDYHDALARQRDDSLRGEVAGLALWAADEVVAAERRVRELISGLQARLDRAKTLLVAGRPLNHLGEVQAAGPELDTAIAELEVRRRVWERLAVDYDEA